MNIREVIERLDQVAAELPAGLDSEVRVHICNGHDAPGFMTPSIEVDMMWVQDERTLEAKDSFAIIQGHPHLDEDVEGSTTRPLTMNVDDVVQQWAAEQAGDVSPAVGRRDRTADLDFVVDPDTGTRFVVLHRPGQTSIKLELGDDGTIRYSPGAADSVAAGCTCDPGRNNQGVGGLRDDSRVFIIKDGCPLHEQIDPPSVSG